MRGKRRLPIILSKTADVAADDNAAACGRPRLARSSSTKHSHFRTSKGQAQRQAQRQRQGQGQGQDEDEDEDDKNNEKECGSAAIKKTFFQWEASRIGVAYLSALES